MGYYIDMHQNKGKAAELVKHHGGKIITQEEASEIMDANGDDAVIVVVDNGTFEAAAYAFDRREFDYFCNNTGGRTITFVSLHKPLANKLTGYK